MSPSTATRKIDHAIVAFEADELDVANCSGWSVIMTGRGRFVRDTIGSPLQDR
jgi:hypothetical protein